MIKNFALSAVIVLGLAACNQADEADMQAKETTAQTASDETAMDATVANKDKSEAVIAYEAANAKMHAAMNAVDNDPDVAFMQGMIPHHEGAVEMAQVVLKYGKDPEALALAKEVIEAQTKEIAQMTAWLKKHKAEPAAASDVDHAAMGH